MDRWIAGALGGAVGTTVINAVTNLDMAVRGRPPSSVPEETVAPAARRVGLVDPEPGARGRHRLTGLGALSGTATGVAAGVAFALVRPRLARLPAPLAGLALGLAAMAATDTAATVAGATDPRRWEPTSWAADLIPHAVYGITTAAVVDALRP